MSASRPKFSLGQAGSHQDHSATPAPVVDFEQDEKEEAGHLPAAEPVESIRRSTRAPKKKQDDDYVFGSELEHHVNLSSVAKVDGGEDGDAQVIASSPRK
jgi:hypothetical protein